MHVCAFSQTLLADIRLFPEPLYVIRKRAANFRDFFVCTHAESMSFCIL